MSKRVPPNPPPRYDDVYFEGTAKLDAMAAGTDPCDPELACATHGRCWTHSEDWWDAFRNESNEERAIDFIFQCFDDLFRNSYFVTADSMLKEIDVAQLNTTRLCAVLAATLPAKDKLPSRGALVARVETKFKHDEPARVARLMQGLR